MEAVARITNHFFTNIIFLDRISFLHPVSWCAFLFSITCLYSDHREEVVVVSNHLSFFPFRESYLLVRKCCTWDSKPEENNFWLIQAMKCEGLLIYNLILAEFHMRPSSSTHWAKNRTDVWAHFSPSAQTGVLSAFGRNTIFISRRVINIYLCSLQEGHFILASVKMSGNTTTSCFCISIRALFISSYVYALMSGGLCTISKIVEESIKPNHVKFIQFRNENRTGWDYSKQWKLQYLNMGSSRQAK